MMPIRSTAPIRALRPGLAKNAAMICLYSTTVTSAHSTRNTSIRTRKIRGDDSLLSSISISEREEWPEGICGCHPLRKAALGNQYGTAGWRKKLGSRDFEETMLKPFPKACFDISVFCNVSMSNRDFRHGRLN